MSEYTRRKLLGTSRRAIDSPVDDFTGHIIMLPYEAHEVLQGNMWAFSQAVPSVAAGQYLSIQINSGVRPVHLRLMRMWAHAPRVLVEVFPELKAEDFDTGTSEIQPAQVNRLVETAAPQGVSLFSNPINVAVDPEWRQYFGGGGSAGVANTDELIMETPLIMKPESFSIIRMKNEDAVARAMSMNGLLFVEER